MYVCKNIIVTTANFFYMSNQEELEFKNLTPEVEANRAYWLVRTMGGDYYDEYVSRKYIAIGYNEVPQSYIEDAIKTGDEAQKLLVEKIEVIDEEEDINKSYAASQLLKFHRDMKVGDVIIVPGRRSEKVKIGYIDSKVYTETNVSKDTYACPFNKRRKVEWVKEFSRGRLNPKLQLMFNSRHIISNVDSYAEYIDSLINDFYIKDNLTFLVIKVQTENEIAVNDFSGVFDVINLLEDYAEENQLPFNTSDINIKISVQSPGDILLSIVNNPQALFILGFLILLINGGGFKIEKLGVDLSTPGLLKSISEFLDRRTDRKTKEKIAKKLENMDIKNPNDIIKLIDKSKNPRKDY